jgi:hypothetical protein
MSFAGVMKMVAMVGVVILVAVIMPVSADMPTYRGIGYPDTFWARLGYNDTVTGKVIASSSASIGIPGAYVAIVNASNESVEYGNTTSDASGNYTFTGVSATFYQTYDPYNDPQYRIYAFKEGYGETYSTPFGIDVSTIGEPVVMWAVLPVNTSQTQNSPIPSSTPTPTPTDTAVPTPTPSPTPSQTPGWSLKTIGVIGAVIFLILVAAGAYLYVRRR